MSPTKGGDRVNYLKREQDFIGLYEGKMCIKEFLEMVKSMKETMGEKAYILDTYVSLFFQSQNIDLLFSVATQGNSKGIELRGLCKSAIEQNANEHPFYERLCEILMEHAYIRTYQEKATKIHLLMIVGFDEFLGHTIKEYEREQKELLEEEFDVIRFEELYEEIARLGNESEVEEFAKRLKETFLQTTFVAAFVQGILDEVMICLAARDLESNECMFSICAKHL